MYRCEKYYDPKVHDRDCAICFNNEIICKECREVECPIAEGKLYPNGKEACDDCRFKIDPHKLGERKNKIIELKDIVDMMNIDDYKERFKTEYWQLKIRMEEYLHQLELRAEIEDIDLNV